MTTPRELYRRWGNEPYLGPSHGENFGVRAQRSYETSAAVASAMLRDATIRAIITHADETGTDVDTAASFLLSRGKAV